MNSTLEHARLNLSGKREEKGIALREIANSTHLGLPYLEAIEAEDFAQLPHGVYAVSFIRQYAAAVGCDEAELIARYRECTAPQTVATEIAGPYLQYSKSPRRSWWKKLGFRHDKPSSATLEESRMRAV